MDIILYFNWKVLANVMNLEAANGKVWLQGNSL